VALADFFADRGYCGLDEARRGPVAARAADGENKVFDDLGAERRVVHLGMELHSPDALLNVFKAGHSVS